MPTEKLELDVVVPVVEASLAVDNPPEPVERFTTDETIAARSVPPADERKDLALRTAFIADEAQQRQLKIGPGVVRDILSTEPGVTAGTILLLRDGLQGGGKILFRFKPTAQHFFGGLRLPFTRGLSVELTGGPAFGAYTITFE